LTVIVDKVAPTVDGVTLSDKAKDVALDSNVTATFSEKMKPETLSTSTVKLVKQGSSSPVTASVSCDDPCRTVTLDPEASQLDEGATYTATIKVARVGSRT
jgi:hypothetical protein